MKDEARSRAVPVKAPTSHPSKGTEDNRGFMAKDSHSMLAHPLVLNLVGIVSTLDPDPSTRLGCAHRHRVSCVVGEVHQTRRVNFQKSVAISRRIKSNGDASSMDEVTSIGMEMRRRWMR